MATATVHHLTNGETNLTFRITGDTATVISLAPLRWAKITRQPMAIPSARDFFAQALKFGFTRGFTRHQPMRKLTTEAQYAAWAANAFDFEANDNDAETELAWSEDFQGQGYIEVPA